jgi:quinol monooxygenase YgiN
MTFIQIVEMRSRNIEELRALYERWEQATQGTATLRRSLLTRDRNDPDRVTIIAFFDSYEAAMENSELPETTALARNAAALADGSLAFHDLDVLDDHPGTTRMPS